MKPLSFFLLVCFALLLTINCENNPTATTYSTDTLYVINNDTLIIKDTVYIVDSTNSKYIVQEGILTADMYTSTGGYWSIPSVFGFIDSIVIQTFVSVGPGYIWIVPSWGLDQFSVRIFADGPIATVTTGWQYRLVGIYKFKSPANNN